MIPNLVRIAGIDYTVSEINNLDRVYGLLGQVLYPISTINLDADMSKERKEQVLIHEILHACFHEAGYEEQDEEMVNRLGIVLYQVLKDNKLYFGE